MTGAHDDRPEPPAPNRGPDDGPAPLLSRLVRSVFAPDVLERRRQGRAPSPRGRLIFRSIVTILVVAIAVLVVTGPDSWTGRERKRTGGSGRRPRPEFRRPQRSPRKR